jgi:hypothetical protein
MEIDNIVYTALNQILSNLCLEYYNETDEEKKKLILIKIKEIETKKNDKNIIDKN